MRRLLGLAGLVAAGVLLGFLTRLVWPRAAADAYRPAG